MSARALDRGRTVQGRHDLQTSTARARCVAQDQGGGGGWGEGGGGGGREGGEGQSTRAESACRRWRSSIKSSACRTARASDCCARCSPSCVSPEVPASVRPSVRPRVVLRPTNNFVKTCVPQRRSRPTNGLARGGPFGLAARFCQPAGNVLRDRSDPQSSTRPNNCSGSSGRERSCMTAGACTIASRGLFHQQCVRHLQRRCQELLETAVRGASACGSRCVALIDRAFALRRAWHGHRLGRDDPGLCRDWS